MAVKGKKAITLFVDSELYNRYKRLCSEKGLKMSKGFEFYMQSQLSGQKVSENDLEILIKKKVQELLGIREGRHG